MTVTVDDGHRSAFVSRGRRYAVGATLAVLAAGSGAAGQSHRATAAPTFKAGVETVEVDVVVTTRHGQPIADLAERDFHVLEDGKPQVLTAFARVDIPIVKRDRAAAALPAVDADVITNERAAEGRMYVLIIDDLHLSSRWVDRAKLAARGLIDRLGPDDLMAVVHTAGSRTANQEFTASRQRLQAAVDQTVPHALDSAIAVTNENLQASDGLAGGDTHDLERARNADVTLRTVQDVSQWFETVHGRRTAVLLISEGIDYPMALVDAPDLPNKPSDMVMNSARAAIDAAMRSNVSVYAIDPSGSSAVDDIGTDYFAPKSPSLGPRAAQREHAMAQENLRWVSEQTGGIAVIGRSDLDKPFDAIVADTSTYYVLAYVAPVHKRDGRFHTISVRVDRPGTMIRSRAGYRSPKGDARPTESAGPSRELRDALATPLPVAGLPIRVSLAPFKGRGGDASVLMTEELIGDRLKLGAGNTLEMSYVALDMRGAVRAERHDRLELNSLNENTAAQIQRSGIRLFSRLDLPPGRYSVRLAAHDDRGGITGSVGYDLDVPDYDNQALSMSGLVLTSMSAGRMIVAKADGPTSEVLPAPPITDRTFSSDDQVWLFAEVYDNLGDVRHTTTIATTLQSDAGAVAYAIASDHDPAQFRGQHGTFRYRVRVPLSGIRPGRYVLAVEARTTGDRIASTTRKVPITVVPATPQ